MNSLSCFLRSKLFSHRNKVLFIVIIGLLISQIISTLMVYYSNKTLFNKCEMLILSGYLVVPNQIVAQGLTKPGPAFWGGLFFTLSVGAGAIVLSFFLAVIWKFFYPNDRKYLYSVTGFMRPAR